MSAGPRSRYTEAMLYFDRSWFETEAAEPEPQPFGPQPFEEPTEPLALDLDFEFDWEAFDEEDESLEDEDAILGGGGDDDFDQDPPLLGDYSPAEPEPWSRSPFDPPFVEPRDDVSWIADDWWAPTPEPEPVDPEPAEPSFWTQAFETAKDKAQELYEWTIGNAQATEPEPDDPVTEPDVDGGMLGVLSDAWEAVVDWKADADELYLEIHAEIPGITVEDAAEVHRIATEYELDYRAADEIRDARDVYMITESLGFADAEQFALLVRQEENAGTDYGLAQLKAHAALGDEDAIQALRLVDGDGLTLEDGQRAVRISNEHGLSIDDAKSVIVDASGTSSGLIVIDKSTAHERIVFDCPPLDDSTDVGRETLEGRVFAGTAPTGLITTDQVEAARAQLERDYHATLERLRQAQARIDGPRLARAQLKKVIADLLPDLTIAEQSLAKATASLIAATPENVLSLSSSLGLDRLSAGDPEYPPHLRPEPWEYTFGRDTEKIRRYEQWKLLEEIRTYLRDQYTTINFRLGEFVRRFEALAFIEAKLRQALATRTRRAIEDLQDIATAFEQLSVPMTFTETRRSFCCVYARIAFAKAYLELAETSETALQRKEEDAEKEAASYWEWEWLGTPWSEERIGRQLAKLFSDDDDLIKDAASTVDEALTASSGLGTLRFPVCDSEDELRRQYRRFESMAARAATKEKDIEAARVRWRNAQKDATFAVEMIQDIVIDIVLTVATAGVGTVARHTFKTLYKKERAARSAERARRFADGATFAERYPRLHRARLEGKTPTLTIAPPARPAHPTFHPGPYAGKSILARSSGRKFTAAERAEIDRIGRATGCHTCGIKDPGTRTGHFVPDHQPVSSLIAEGTPQRLYPHCITCSREQGLAAARAARRGQ